MSPCGGLAGFQRSKGSIVTIRTVSSDGKSPDLQAGGCVFMKCQLTIYSQISINPNLDIHKNYLYVQTSLFV